MAAQTPKMSLVAQFDDLCRYSNVLMAGCEEEFKTFVVAQRNLMHTWKEDASQIEALKKKIGKLETEKGRYELQMKNMRRVYEEECTNRKKLQAEKNSLETQIALIKEVLLSNGNTMDNETKEKLFQISHPKIEPQVKLSTIQESVGSILSASDFDPSDDDSAMNVSRRRKRRSKGNRRSSGVSEKRKKSEQVEIQSTDEDFRMEVAEAVPERKEVNFRSNSEPHANSPDNPTPRPIHRSDSEHVKGRTLDFRMPSTGSLHGGTPVGRFSTGGKLSRTHAFVNKTVIRTEKCYPCGKLIKFMKQALKCTDCRITCHPECKNQCPLPCVPVTYTPTRCLTGTISDYTSSTSPMIPSLIVHCVNEIELRGLKEIGLYRVSGSEREVKDLKEKLIKGRNVTLSQADIHAVCGAVKEFLRSLKDPLLTRAVWRDFVEAAENIDASTSLNLLYSYVCDLPQPNKETLAFLILHLQRVAESPDCRMPLENLAKVFGPTIVGYSSAEPLDSDMLTETRQQCQVMRRLLMLPADSWQNILNVDPQEVFVTQKSTPDTLPAPKVSRLGPIYPSHDLRSRSVHVSRTTLTPRTPKYSSRTGRRQFLSPLLK